MWKDLWVYRVNTKENGEFRFIVNSKKFMEIQRVAEQESIEKATEIFNSELDKNLAPETFKNILDEIKSYKFYA